jgi:hypothetical protein
MQPHQPPPPHDFETNIVRISTWRNVQKVRKPNVNIALRNKTYWDLRGRWQHEYDARLDALPDDGIAQTVSSSSFPCRFSVHCNIYSSIILCCHCFLMFICVTTQTGSRRDIPCRYQDLL